MDWQAYLAKARNNLHTAPHAYAQGDYDSCASRAYFAVFHGEMAALIKLTAFRQDRWGHDRGQEEFNRRLIRARKSLPAALRSIHNDLNWQKSYSGLYRSTHQRPRSRTLSTTS